MCKLSCNTVVVIIIMSLFVGCKTTTNMKRNKKRDLYIPKHDLRNKCLENICNVTKSYPKKHLHKLLLNSQEFKEYSGLVIQPYDEISVNSRWNSGDFKNMCKTKKYMMFPKAARNVNLEWKFIVQTKNLTQKVWFETCLTEKKEHYTENQSCFASEFVPNDYITSCQQQKVSVKLLALNSNGSLAVDHFPVPGSCVCTYAKIQTID